MQLQPRLPVRLVAAVPRDAHVPGRDPLHRAVVVEQHLGRREAGEDLHAQLLGPPRQPAAQIAERAGVGSLVVQEGRGPQVRQDVFLLARQNPVKVLRHRRFGKRAVRLAPVGDQLVHRARIDHRSRHDVRADFRPLFQHASAGSRRSAPPDRRRRSPRHRASTRVRTSLNSLLLGIPHLRRGPATLRPIRRSRELTSSSTWGQ